MQCVTVIDTIQSLNKKKLILHTSIIFPCTKHSWRLFSFSIGMFHFCHWPFLQQHLLLVSLDSSDYHVIYFQLLLTIYLQTLIDHIFHLESWTTTFWTLTCFAHLGLKQIKQSKKKFRVLLETGLFINYLYHLIWPTLGYSSLYV